MEYKLIRSKRRTLSVSIGDDLIPIVKSPDFLSDSEIEAFVVKNTQWINSAVKRKAKHIEKYNISEEAVSDFAKRLKDKVEYYSSLTQLKPTAVKITKAKTRFGSCSGKNSLCFSCYLANYPDEAVDYVVLHEIAHIKYHNHGKEFYGFISKYMPDYKEREKLLKE